MINRIGRVDIVKRQCTFRVFDDLERQHGWKSPFGNGFFIRDVRREVEALEPAVRQAQSKSGLGGSYEHPSFIN